MSKPGLYTVRISGLGEGNHDFSFELDNAFFASFENPDLERGLVTADVILEKKAGHLSLHFVLSGKVEVVCDRCLDPFMKPVSAKQKLFVKHGDERGEIDDDVIVISRDMSEIDVAQHLYEYVVLALPVQKTHPDTEEGDPTCNPEMLEKLESLGSNEEETTEETDPRWDALKDILDKNK